MLLQKMTMQATWIALGVELVSSVEDLETTMDLFGDSHVVLLRGVSALGLPATETICTLEVMMTVSFQWSLYEPIVEQIAYDSAASTSVIEELRVMTDEMAEWVQAAVVQYKSDDQSCDPQPTYDEWVTLLNAAGKQRMLVQRISRQFFQIMKVVNLESSQVTFTTTKILGEDSVRELIEGDLSAGVPTPPAQDIADALLLLWYVWEDFNEKVTTSSTHTDVDVGTLEKIAADSNDCLQLANTATELYVETALEQDPTVRAHVLNLAGRQRMLIEKMGKEAVLLSLGVDVLENIDNLFDSIETFIMIHESLLVGNESLGLDVTTDHCTLQQMQTVWDLWQPYEILIRTTGQETTNTDLTTLQSIDNQATPLFDAMNVAVSYLADGEGACTRTFTSVEWEELIREAAHLGEWTQRMAKDVCLMSKDVDFGVHQASLANVTDRIDVTLRKLRFGSTLFTLPAPPTAAVIAQILLFDELWSSSKALVDATFPTPAAAASSVDVVLETSLSLLRAADTLTSLYVDGAWEDDETVNGTRILTAGRQVTLIEEILKNSVCLGYSNLTLAGLSTSIAEYETKENHLLNGVSGSERKYDIKVTDEETLLTQMEIVSTAYAAFEPLVVSIADGGATGNEQLQAVVGASEALLLELGVAAELYKHPTVDTRLPLHILTPMPLTGSTPFGATLSISQLVALDIINTDGILLPGFVLVGDTFDDQCDADYGQREVLDRIASQQWIALGGLSCPDVCISTASIADALRLPFVSYECAASELLSDTTLYPSFLRLGSSFVRAPSALLALAPLLSWQHVTIVSETSTDMLELARSYASSLEAGGLSTSSSSAYADDFESMKDMVSALQANKRRVVLVVGDENFYRTLLCATEVVGVFPGMTWLSMHSFRRAWWTQDDADLMALASACTGAALTQVFQGALNVAGLGLGLDTDRDKPLTCFPGHTSRTLHALIETHLTNGFPSGAGNAVEFPYMNILSLGADGVCILALAIQEMLSRGYTLDQLYSRETATYDDMVTFMREELAFEGVSGFLEFTGNDRLGYLAIWQVLHDDLVLVGHVPPDDTEEVTLYHGSLSNASWAGAPQDSEESSDASMIVFIAVLAAVCLIVVPVCMACVSLYRRANSLRRK